MARVWACVWCLVVALAMAGAAARTRPGLDIDIPQLLKDMKDPKMVEEQVACLVDQGPCDQRGETLKRYLPLVGGGGNCFRCTRQENRNLRLVVATMQRRYPACWNVILAEYEKRPDPRPKAKGCA